MRLILVVLLFSLCSFARAQQRQIKGMLKTGSGKPVTDATVSIKDGQHKVRTFKSSDANGAFVLILPDTVKLDGWFLEVNSLGYKKSDIPLQNGKIDYEIVMEEQAINLSEIQVKSKPRINVSGDTLKYSVGSFAKAEDRSIGDVIKRMPGMEVAENGQIKYNGKSISNFYIDGDDLLSDRYGAGTKAIPYNMVQDLEVMQRHQPVKVLKGKALSDQVAINLKIKEEAKLKLAGQIKAGAGLPGQYDDEFNAILFNKKYKMFNVLKANNIGTDLGPELQGFNQAGHSTPSLLSTGTVGAPPLPVNRYYLNNSGALNANNLFKIWNNWQLKTNAGLLLDKNNMNYLSLNETYATQDTIRYREQQSINRRLTSADVSIELESNKDNYYFNNTVKLSTGLQLGTAALLSNDMDMNQHIKTQTGDFSNQLQYMPAIGRHNVLSFNWYLSHSNSAERLNINPGINADVLNAGVPYAAAIQDVEIPSWFSNALVGFRLAKGLIKQNYQLNLESEWQHLDSKLRLDQSDGQEWQYAGSADNQLRWNRHRLGFNGSYELKKEKWEASLSLPLSLQHIAYQDKEFDLDEQKNRILFNPVIMGKYFLHGESYLSANYTFSNQTGNINDVYRGVILTNYRSLEANDAALQEQYAHNFAVNYNFQRTITMLFINAGISYTKAEANSIASREITNNISRTILLPYANDISTFSANVGFSKYIFALDATAGLKGAWNSTRYNQFVNSELLPYNNISYTGQSSVEARLWDKISLRYEGTGTWTISKLLHNAAGSSLPDQHIMQFDQSVGMGYAPFKSTFVRLSGRHQYTAQQQMQHISYFFTDASIRYNLQKWRMDLELNATNLANIKSYDTFSLSANQFGYNHYNLRGRMAVIKLVFNI